MNASLRLMHSSTRCYCVVFQLSRCRSHHPCVSGLDRPTLHAPQQADCLPVLPDVYCVVFQLSCCRSHHPCVSGLDRPTLHAPQQADRLPVRLTSGQFFLMKAHVMPTFPSLSSNFLIIPRFFVFMPLIFPRTFKTPQICIYNVSNFNSANVPFYSHCCPTFFFCFPTFIVVL